MLNLWVITTHECLFQTVAVIPNLLKCRPQILALFLSKKLIYLQTDDAGSSSPMMLGMLRNAAGLEQRGCKLLDGRDAIGINHTTKKLGEGAIIYIDDFVGTGDQFSKARNFAMQSVVGCFRISVGAQHL